MVGASCITRFLLLPLPLSSAHRKLVTRRIHDSCLPREGRVHQGVLPSKIRLLGQAVMERPQPSVTVYLDSRAIS